MSDPLPELPLTDEQRRLVADVRAFCDRELGSRERRAALTDGGARRHSAEIYAPMAAAGWMGLAIPEDHGGAGGTILDACLFAEEAWRGLAPIAGYGTSLVVARAVERSGSDRQRGEVLAAIAGGSIAAVAITERDAGSDVAAIATVARPEPDGHVLDGEKLYCSNADVAERILVACRSDGGHGRGGLTLVIVESSAPGVAIEPIESLGGAATCRIRLSGVRVGPGAVVGEPGRGWEPLMALLDDERLVIAAVQLGFARRALEDALEHVRNRNQFGRPIGSFQVVQHRLAELATELQAARLMMAWAAERAAEPDDGTAARSAMAKLNATEVAKRVALEALQLMGARGYSAGADIERLVRETLAGTIYGGTSEIQRSIIARGLGL